MSRRKLHQVIGCLAVLLQESLQTTDIFVPPQFFGDPRVRSKRGGQRGNEGTQKHPAMHDTEANNKKPSDTFSTLDHIEINELAWTKHLRASPCILFSLFSLVILSLFCKLWEPALQQQLSLTPSHVQCASHITTMCSNMQQLCYIVLHLKNFHWAIQLATSLSSRTRDGTWYTMVHYDMP